MRLNPIQKSLKHRGFVLAMIVSERILIDIGLKIFRADRMINARNATLNQRPEAVYGVDMDISHHIDLIL